MGILSVLSYCFIVIVSILVCIEDISHKRLSNALTVGSFVIYLSILLAISMTQKSNYGHLRSAIVSAFLLSMGYLVLHLLNPPGFGLGDAKFSLFIGAALGWHGIQEVAIGTFLAFLTAGVFAAGVLLLTRENRKSTFPFGPFMVLGMWMALLT